MNTHNHSHENHSHEHGEGAHAHAGNAAAGQHACCSSSAKTPENAVTDPVCGMKVDPHTARHSAEHAGRTYYFCSARCREKFVAEPARYLGGESAAVAPPPAGTIYTCPMHPEVRQVG
ncbi:MAG: YHS domain-containing protein, partial [Proteobacteria bacterium]|nr:YHS domain-containing protein [Pseudomonadota bacterium]